MIKINPTIWRAARRALEKAVTLHLDDPNVSLIDLGFRIRSLRGNRLEPQLAVRVHVRQKLYGDAFKTFAAREPQRVIDAQQNGFAVDIPQAAYQLHLGSQPPLINTQHTNELRGGIGITNTLGHGYGTLGGKVRDRQSGEDMILSTWHALVGSWSGQPGLSIYQSHRENVDAEANVIAQYSHDALYANLDAAVARLSGQRRLLNEQLGIGAVTGAVIPQLGMRVIKSGAATGVTRGIITGVLGYAIHRYGGVNRLVGPIIHITPEETGKKISVSGDSGAWWLERSSLRAAALHFAGSNDPEYALALSMPFVLQALDVDIVAESPKPSLVRLSNLPVAKTDKSIAATDVEVIGEEDLSPSNDEAGIVPYNIGLKPLGSSSSRIQKNVAAQITQTSSLIVLCVMAMGFGFHLFNFHRQQKEKIEQLQSSVQDLFATAKVDSARHYNIRKVAAIIDLYNPEMPSELKYRLAAEIYQMSRKYRQLDVELICATITHETGRTWNPEAVSYAGAMGLMQLLPSTARLLAEDEKIAWTSNDKILFDPICNIRLGCRYLAGLVETYSVDGGLAAYNGGEKRAERWVRNGRAHGILHEETASYVPSILKIYKEYQQMGI